MVEQGHMPKPKRIKARVVWDRREIDDAFDSLPGEDREPPPAYANPWDAMSNT
jgi:hypothetical protein